MNFVTLCKNADSELYYVKGSCKDGEAIYSKETAEEHLQPESDTFDDGGKKIIEKNAEC